MALRGGMEHGRLFLRYVNIVPTGAEKMCKICYTYFIKYAITF